MKLPCNLFITSDRIYTANRICSISTISRVSWLSLDVEFIPSLSLQILVSKVLAYC